MRLLDCGRLLLKVSAWFSLLNLESTVHVNTEDQDRRHNTVFNTQTDTEMYSARPYRFDHWTEPVVVSCPQQRRCGRQWDREEGQKHLSFPFLPPAFGPHPALCGSLLVSNRHVLEGRRIKFFPQVQKPLAPLFPRLGFLFFSAYQWVFCEAGICLCVFTVFVCSSIKVDEQGRFWVSFWHKDTTQGQTDLKVKIICSFVSYQHVINVITSTKEVIFPSAFVWCFVFFHKNYSTNFPRPFCGGIWGMTQCRTH